MNGDTLDERLKAVEHDVNEGIVLPQLRDYGFRLEKGTSELSQVSTNAVVSAPKCIQTTCAWSLSR